MQKKPPPIIDAEFEVISPPRRKSWVVSQLERVPLAFWLVAAMALASVAKVSQP